MASKALDGVLIKKAHSQVTYSEQQIIDLQKCADPDTGYLYFLTHFFYIQHPVKGQLLYDPYSYQLGLLKSYHNHRQSISLLPRQSGKALSLDTKLPTIDGWTTINDIKVGDNILGNDGKCTKVTYVTEVMYDHDCYNIEFDNGEIIIADSEHLWEVNNNNWNISNKILTTKQILEYISSHSTDQPCYIKITEPIIGNEKILDIPPYTLGLWLGDGHSHSEWYTQSYDDNKEIKEYIEKDGFIVSNNRQVSENSEVVRINNLKSLLIKHNLICNKHIPNEYLRASINQRLELLKGLMDSDGSVDKKGSCEFYQKNYNLIIQVRELISSLGIKTKISYKIINGQKYYTLRFTSIRYDVFKLSRKLNRQRLNKNHAKNSRIYIKSITKTESVPVKCIRVDNENHLFLCGNTMIATHNTTTAAGYLLWYAMFHSDKTILVAAHKGKGALEIMQRIRYGYELCPNHIRCGVTGYNKGSIEFDNNSRIISETTTADTGRGKAISLLYCLDGDTTYVTVRNKFTLKEEYVTLKELYQKLLNAQKVIS